MRKMANGVQSISLSLVARIRTDILRSHLLPERKLTLKMLTAMYDCGATPLREALSQLASEGIVVRIDKRGFFVAPISREDFEDILFNRCFLEAEAIRRSIWLGGADWEERVVLSHYRLESVPSVIQTPGGSIDNPAWEAAHKRFHMDLLSACASPILLAQCDRLHELNNRYRHISRRASSLGDRDVLTEHAELRTLALSRQADEAAETLVSHYRRTGRAIFRAD
jgi:GntR family carbon starvation induced transcriptional regulator